MNTQHTPRLLSMVGQVDGWNADHDGIGSSCYSGIRVADTGEVIALAVAHTTDLSANPDCRSDARRLVACWNACDGISTDVLEKGRLSSDAFQLEESRADRAEVNSETLLTALRRLSFAAMARDITMGDQCALFAAQAELRDANKQAMAAITKTTGSAS